MQCCRWDRVQKSLLIMTAFLAMVSINMDGICQCHFSNINFVYFVQGLMDVVRGPTLLDLRDLMGTTVERISWIFPAFSVGSLAGSFAGALNHTPWQTYRLLFFISFFCVAGFLLDRFLGHRFLLLSVVLTLLGVATAAVPFALNLIVLCALAVMQGIASGALDTGTSIRPRLQTRKLATHCSRPYIRICICIIINGQNSPFMLLRSYFSVQCALPGHLERRGFRRRSLDARHPLQLQRGRLCRADRRNTLSQGQTQRDGFGIQWSVQ